MGVGNNGSEFMWTVAEQFRQADPRNGKNSTEVPEPYISRLNS